MWKNKESYVDEGGVFDLSIIKHVTLQKIVAHYFRYDPRTYFEFFFTFRNPSFMGCANFHAFSHRHPTI